MSLAEDLRAITKKAEEDIEESRAYKALIDGEWETLVNELREEAEAAMWSEQYYVNYAENVDRLKREGLNLVDNVQHTGTYTVSWGEKCHQS